MGRFEAETGATGVSGESGGSESVSMMRRPMFAAMFTGGVTTGGAATEGLLSSEADRWRLEVDSRLESRDFKAAADGADGLTLWARDNLVEELGEDAELAESK